MIISIIILQVVFHLPTLVLSVFKNKWDDYCGEWSDWNSEGEVFVHHLHHHNLDHHHLTKIIIGLMISAWFKG